MTSGARIAWTALALCVVLACLGGCGGNEENASAGENVSANVDSARATARAFFEHVRSICNEEYPDADAYYALVHTETPKQNAWVAHVHNTMLPRVRFAKACQEKFGERPPGGSAMVWEIAEFTWKKEDADRAEIECINDHGVKTPLHLVKVGDQWWISGYSFEYGKHIGFDDPRFDGLMQSLPGIGPYIDRVTARVRAGEFATLEEAEEAQSDAIGEYSDEHPRPRP